MGGTSARRSLRAATHVLRDLGARAPWASVRNVPRASLAGVTGRELPDGPPFALRARLLTPLDDGGTRHEPDGLLVVDAAGRLAYAGPADAAPAADARHGRRPPAVGGPARHGRPPRPPAAAPERRARGRDGPAGLARALHLPARARLRRRRRPSVVAPAAWRAFAAAGTTTALVYGAVYEASLDATFRAAEAHGIRAIVGKVMMDRITYDPTIDPADDPRSERWPKSARLIERWHGADGRPAALRRHAAVRRLVHGRAAARVGGPRPRRPAPTGRRTCPRTAARSPRSRGCSPTRSTTSTSTTAPAGSGQRTVLAHAVHLSDRELDAPGGDGDARRPLPDLEPVPRVGGDAARALPRGRAAGRVWARTWPAGPDLSIFSVMRVGFYAQNARRVAGVEAGRSLEPARLAPPRLAGRRAGARARRRRPARSRPARRPTSSRSIRPSSRRSPAGRRRRPRGPRDPPDLPRASRHGPRRLGPRPPPGGAGRPRLTSLTPEVIDWLASVLGSYPADGAVDATAGQHVVGPRPRGRPGPALVRRRPVPRRRSRTRSPGRPRR